MSSYLSNLLTSTTSRYNNIRRTLLSNEDDGDTEDDSHISRVLRAYYTEKGRPLPPWLPPDPTEARQTPRPQIFSQSPSGYFSSSARNQPAAMQANNAGGRSSLSDLWDPQPTPGSNAPMQPQSLRAGRKPVATYQPPNQPSSTLAPPPPQARPLPSQRAGSMQSIASQRSERPSFESAPSSSAGYGGTAQDRLKARLWGGNASGGSRTGSPVNTGGYGRPG